MLFFSSTFCGNQTEQNTRHHRTRRHHQFRPAGNVAADICLSRGATTSASDMPDWIQLILSYAHRLRQRLRRRRCVIRVRPVCSLAQLYAVAVSIGHLRVFVYVMPNYPCTNMRRTYRVEAGLVVERWERRRRLEFLASTS